MKKLDLNKHRILFVVDVEKKLIGSLTDGDIRRWILSGKDLQTKIINVCHKSPVTLKSNYTKQQVKDLMLEQRIACIPILNDNKQIQSIVFWTDIFTEKSPKKPLPKLDLPVVIMAGGFGKRLYPFTAILPKPLIPIGEKSIVEHIIEKFKVYGIKDFYMTLNHKSKVIKSYFEEVSMDYNLNFVVEKKPLGTAGSLKLLEDSLPDRFIVTNCDIMIHVDYSEIVDFHQKNNYDVSLVSAMMHYQIPYGICEIDTGGKLIEIKEKPEYNFFISTGLYILNKKVIDFIPDGEFFNITQLMEKIIKNGGTVGVFPISEKSWDDTGEWDEYNKTIKRLIHD